MTDEGYATAEAAVAIPALVAVLGLAIGAVVAVGAQLRCVDAARAAAREVARGDTDAEARRTAQEIAPGAEVTVRRRGERVEVVVRGTVRAGRWLPGLPVSGRAVTEAEP